MVFKRLLGSLGAGAPTVDTVLAPAPVLPNGTLAGQVHIRGGQTAFDQPPHPPGHRTPRARCRGLLGHRPAPRAAHRLLLVL
ncbi:hypothetical protein GCM10023323_23500 [Streptomyces thinghirensis]|uniref:Uncharacterized protein n=1 Tax=Streptomyces thinghirensis TaxID=551547 RepID=A0ABP9T2D2_9ACTN